jgi:hypothetical protein
MFIFLIISSAMCHFRTVKNTIVIAVKIPMCHFRTVKYINVSLQNSQTYQCVNSEQSNTWMCHFLTAITMVFLTVLKWHIGIFDCSEVTHSCVWLFWIDTLVCLTVLKWHIDIFDCSEVTHWYFDCNNKGIFRRRGDNNYNPGRFLWFLHNFHHCTIAK